MIERIVYLLGAGFSAPLGLPVTSDFLVKSKDLFAEDPERYPHFQEVFQEVAKLSVIKNYFEADLFNIEEILSILEMNAQLDGQRLRDSFVRYIQHVVLHYTPVIRPYKDQLPGNWHAFVLGTDAVQKLYGFFVASLFGLHLRVVHANSPITYERFTVQQTPPARYAVVTLNYDCVLENCADFITRTLTPSRPVAFRPAGQSAAEVWEGVPIVKLHGSVNSPTIVPPTWSKALHPEIVEAWRCAFAILRDATQIRVIGYSLPDADTYVRYLLKSAVSLAPHLKAIDVLSLDPDSSVQRRFNDFITFRYFRFRSANVEQYLQRNYDIVDPSHIKQDEMVLTRLEKAHAKFFSEG